MGNRTGYVESIHQETWMFEEKISGFEDAKEGGLSQSETIPKKHVFKRTGDICHFQLVGGLEHFLFSDINWE